MMFKILVIQAANTLSDERAEYLINDRLSFMRDLGLSLGDRVLDARTIWLFRERLTRAEINGRPAVEVLFARFDAALRTAGYIAMSGQIVDATLVAAPRQRNTDEEKAEIKAGRIPAAWEAKPAKLRHKDRDARWTVKFTQAKPDAEGQLPRTDLAIPVFGYQSHIAIDKGFGFIRTWAVTDAAASEGKLLREGLLDKTNTAGVVWADTAYRSKANEPSWLNTASGQRSIARSRRASRCRRTPGGRTAASRRSAPPSSMSLPTRRAAWACSSAPSAWRGRAPRLGWRT
jgi:transposase, IS5 family